MNTRRGILERDECDEYRTDAERNMGKVDMLGEDEAPLREEGDDAVQEESLWQCVCKSCALHTKILGSNRLKIGMSWNSSGHIKFFVTMDEKYRSQKTETGKTARNIGEKRGDREEEAQYMKARREDNRLAFGPTAVEGHAQKEYSRIEARLSPSIHTGRHEGIPGLSIDEFINKQTF